MRPLYEGVRTAQDRLERRLSHETGDRRLDGTDPIDTIRAYGDVAQLVLDRNRKSQAYQRALEFYPPIAQPDGKTDGWGGDFVPSERVDGPVVLSEGPWPGSDEWMTITDRKNPIYMRTGGRKAGSSDGPGGVRSDFSAGSVAVPAEKKRSSI